MNDKVTIMFISVKLCPMLCKGAMIGKQWITKRKFNLTFAHNATMVGGFDYDLIMEWQ